MLISYNDIYKNINSEKKLIDTRLEMVRFAYEHGIKSAARFYKCSKNTIKKWLRRYALYNLEGLKDLSRRPQNSPKRINQEHIDQITETAKSAKEKKKHITVNNIRRTTGIDQYSDTTLNRYINKAVGKKKNRKHDPSNGGDVKWKKKLLPFQLIQIDIKYLTDIPNLQPYFVTRDKKDGITVKYQITARDVATGATIVAYCDDKSQAYTKMFLEQILHPFLKQIPNLDLKKITIQTDNGYEFTNRYARTKGQRPKTSSFTIFVEDKFKKDTTNIPGHCTADSEVESFHWSIERDCLAWDDITNNESLIKYTTRYMENYLKTIIKNRGYSPLDKIKETYESSKLNFPMPQILNVISTDNN